MYTMDGYYECTVTRQNGTNFNNVFSTDDLKGLCDKLLKLSCKESNDYVEMFAEGSNIYHLSAGQGFFLIRPAIKKYITYVDEPSIRL